MQEPKLLWCSKVIWRTFKFERCLLVALASVWLLTGCGKDSGTRLTGTVIFDGKPLESGSILFQQKTSGRAEAGGIVNGKFSIAARSPLPSGSYSVVISSPGPLPPGVHKRGDLPGAPQTIPARYNEQTELVAEVKEGRRNDFAFALEP